MKKPLVLTILDGWGLRKEQKANAIALAKTPNYDRWMQEFPHSVLEASGTAVGLPKGLMGNSEVGHLNIGAGRIVYVGLTKIFSSIEDKSFFKNPNLLQAYQGAKKNKSTLHLMGLVSDGAVHSHQEHLYTLLEMAKLQGVSRVMIHAFTDGRDTPPTSGLSYLLALEEKIKEIGVGKIASVIGRYYAMDRDKRWERTELAYNAMTRGIGTHTSSIENAIKQAYQNGETDEFIKPIVVTDANQDPIGSVRDQDAMIFINFRADRARQLTAALTNPTFNNFNQTKRPKLSSFVCMGEYDKAASLPVAFLPSLVPQTLGEILSNRGLKQLRVAETEKYAHVTFFFNGGVEKVFPGEDRKLVPSPREVPTYDLKPEMSAPMVAEEVLSGLRGHAFDVIIVNFANPDMVGHTGNLQAAIQAVEVVDALLGKIYQEVASQNGTMLVTADHGNCEMMQDDEGAPMTYHTNHQVPFILLSEKLKSVSLHPQGSLADIAPTILQILNIEQPKVMTGRSMIA